MIWDGDCSFCKYWITYFQKDISQSILFSTYQEVAGNYPDIPLKEFQKASRFIETDGTIFSGPDSAYRCLYYSKKSRKIWHELYNSTVFVGFISDHSYNYIAKNRAAMFTATKVLFGSNPKKLKYYWLLYLLLMLILLILIRLYL